ncbi:MAG TPA: PAS domain S-box protein, partial [Longimicrobiaceae bacterium]|nr:PAS domain S-box protein [Longimicrobiaceae bacterium]
AQGMAAGAGVPLAAEDGRVFGALGVLDSLPRSWSADELATLAELAAAAAREVEWRCREVRMREVQHELRLQRAQLDELFEAAPEGIALLDVEERVVRANGEFLRMFGYRPEEVAGVFVNDLIVPPELLEEAERVTRAVTAGRPVSLDTVRRRRDGTRLDVSILGKPVHLDGSPVAIYLVYRDITEHRHALRELRAGEERFRQLAENLRDVFYLNTADRSEVLYVSPAYDRVWGRSREDLYREPRAWLRAVHPDDLERVVRATDGPPGREYELEYRIVRPDGEVRWIRERTIPIRDEEGNVYRDAGIAEDVTARRRAEEDRADAIAARNRFFAMVSHELRTPISAVMLYNDLLLSGAYGPLAEAQADGIHRSQSAAAALLELVNEVLDLARLEAGKMEARAEEFRVAELLREVADAVRPLADENGCALLVEVEDAPETLATDPRRLRQILLNLLSNAVKYGGARPVRVACRRSPERGVLLEVTDQGPGIPPAERERIFEEFVRVGDGSQPGTGLGLTIARRLAELLGGWVEVDSVVGEGSTFRLVLPERGSSPGTVSYG